MTVVASTLVVAAGVVCWRTHNGKVKVLLVRRDSRSDISLPKGKVDPGESLPEAAVRETLEETGIAIALGAPLGATEYSMPTGRDKVVHYWAAEVDDAALGAARFTPTDEISSTEWLPLKTARAKLTYDRDRDILDRFAARLEADSLRTFAIIALRHGKAVPAGSWSGPDSSRPLEQVGIEQARAAARAIAAYRPAKLISSTAARCVSTIEPVARLTGLDVKATAAISQDAFEDGEADVTRLIAKRIARGLSAVLCSHGPVLPVILDEIGVATGREDDRSLRRAAALDTGDFAVVHLSVAHPYAGIVAVEKHSPR